MTAYDPNSREHRRDLASRIVADLDRLGFTRDLERAGEAVYTRSPEPNVSVLVYTSIVGGEVRSLGKDAIRVATIYTGGDRPRGLGSETTIHRRGTVESIAARLVERASHALAVDLPRCRRCNAPTFRSRSGNDVCAAICWERHVTPVVEAARVEAAPAKPARVQAAQAAAEPIGITVLRGRRRSTVAAVDW